MKWVLTLLLVAMVALIAFGAPFGDAGIRREPRFGGHMSILPMHFAHNDHRTVSCTSCHHEFVEHLSGPPCMTCHVTDAKVAPLLEDQFHRLCRDCHVEKNTAGLASGPTRRCAACHVPDSEF